MSSEALDCLEDFAALMQASSRSEDAVRLCAAAAAIRERLAIPGAHRGKARRIASIVAARAALTEDRFDRAWVDGTAWALDDAIECALEFADAPAVTA
jgi:hypothetical protein